AAPGLAPLLGVGLKLLVERRKLGERRVRVRGLVAAVAVGTAFDVFGAQIRVAVGTVAAVATIAMRESIPTRRRVRPLRSIWAIAARRPVAIGAIRAGRPP